MIERIERIAETSVSRGCGFGVLAIFTMMIGFSGEMFLALQAGGYAMLLMSMILILRGLVAEQLDYRRTEVWLMLEPADRPQPAVSQRIIGGILREVYLRFALHAAVLSAGLLIASVLVGFFPPPDPRL